MNSIKTYLVSLTLCVAFLLAGRPAVAQKSLSAYTGQYTQNINGYHAYLNVYIENNKLKVKQSWDGNVRTLEFITDNKFIISMDGWAIKFIRNKANKVVQMEVLANERWTKIYP